MEHTFITDIYNLNQWIKQSIYVRLQMWNFILKWHWYHSAFLKFRRNSSQKKMDLILQDGYSNQATLLSESHSVSSQTYEIELFASIVNSWKIPLCLSNAQHLQEIFNLGWWECNFNRNLTEFFTESLTETDLREKSPLCMIATEFDPTVSGKIRF